MFSTLASLKPKGPKGPKGAGLVQPFKFFERLLSARKNGRLEGLSLS